MDPDSSGKLRLSKALATLAQDPLFKKILDEAQREVDLCFTRTGQRSRAQTSKFTETTSAIKGLKRELESLQHQVTDSSAIEDRVNALRERRARALMRIEEVTTTRSLIHQRVAATRAREETGAHLEAAKAALAEIDAHVSHVQSAETQLEALIGQAKRGESDVARAVADHDALNAAVKVAEENHRLATSEDGVRQRELRRAQLAEQRAALSADRQALENKRRTIDVALKARADAIAARGEAAAARAEINKLNHELEEAQEQASAVETELDFARAVLA